MQTAFQDGALAEECTKNTVVVITKDKGDLRGIGLIEVLWKAITIILKHRLTAAISFHATLHGFWSEKGTDTTALEYNLLQQLTSMRYVVLLEIFLDTRKAYDTIYWKRALDLIAMCGVVPMTVRLLRMYWDRLTMVVKAGGYFIRLFKGYRGVTQGDPLYPTIFNMVVDAIIRHWVTVVTPSESGMWGVGMTIIDLAA